MIKDVTGIELTPGNGGEFCLGNGLYQGTECCCDECEYMICCLDTATPEDCVTCSDKECPHSLLNKKEIF